jgi:hypothetical protein
MFTHFFVHRSSTSVKNLRDNYHGYIHSVENYEAMLARFIVPSS